MGVLKLSKDNAETSACLTASVDLLLHLPTPRSANLDLAQARCLRIPTRLQLLADGTYCDIKSCELATVVLDVIKVEPMMDIVYKDGRLWASLQQLLTDRYT